MFEFCVGIGDLNSGHHACTAGALTHWAISLGLRTNMLESSLTLFSNVCLGPAVSKPYKLYYQSIQQSKSLQFFLPFPASWTTAASTLLLDLVKSSLRSHHGIITEPHPAPALQTLTSESKPKAVEGLRDFWGLIPTACLASSNIMSFINLL